MALKPCIECGDSKPINRFEAGRSRCKSCRSKARYAALKADPQKWAVHLAYMRGVRQQSRSKRGDSWRAHVRQYKRSLSEAKKAEHREKKRAYDATRDKQEQSRKAVAYNRKLETTLKHTQAGQVRQLRHLIREFLRRGRLTKSGKTFDILGACKVDVFSHLGPKPTDDAHYDHICPLRQAQNYDELVRLCHYTNLRWLSKSKNIKKGSAWTEEGAELCRRLLGREWVFK